MLRFAVFGLVTVALLDLGGAHRYRGPEWRQTKIVPGYEDHEPTWDEAHGYEECDEFLNDPTYNENYVEGASDGNAANGLHHLLNRHKPEPFEKICSKYECPNVENVESAGCGFGTKIVPRAKMMVSDIDLDQPLGVREAYKRLYYYRNGNNNDRGQKMGFVAPVLKYYYLDQNSNVVRATIAVTIPEAFQNDPPASTDDQVRVEEFAGGKIYFRAYGGYRQDAEFLQQFDLLKTALEKENITPYPDMRVVAGFTYMRYGRQRLEAILIDNDSVSK